MHNKFKYICNFGHEFSWDQLLKGTIYDARKYFNPEKYREIIANDEEVKKKQEDHFVVTEDTAVNIYA